jgi:hypothetical protein
MNLTTSLRYGLVSVVLVLCLSALDGWAFTISLQEQGALTSVGGGAGSLTISSIGTDHWSVAVTNASIGGPIGPGFNLAFVEPEQVSGMTAYNNVQVTLATSGVLIFDVLSDEFSPYATIVPNGGTAPLQNTSSGMISLQFTDFADSVPEPGIASFGLAGAVALLLIRKR